LSFTIRPQPKQEKFLKSTADIVIYGGSAGGGKTYALLLEPLYHIQKKCFNAVIFRKNLNQVKNAGGLWDTASDIYPLLGAEPKVAEYAWQFESGAKVKFAHLELEKDIYKWQGSQIPLIMFDELTHFSKKQFFYMLSRNRTTCEGIKPYVRATTNPESDSWVRELIDWWIGDNGLPINERDGVIRWFININDTLIFADTKEELIDKYPSIIPKSITFIGATLYDNKILMEADPSYLANLMALPKVERERLLGGNWNIKESAGLYYKREYFEILEPEYIENIEFKKIVRAWDFAYTEYDGNNDPDYAVGLKAGISKDGIIYILDMWRDRVSPLKLKQIFKNIATQDGKGVIQRIPQDPAGGKFVMETLKNELRGYPIVVEKPVKDKITRTLPASAEAEKGNIKIIRADWLPEFLDELENFPEAKHDDIVDTLSDVVDELLKRKKKSKNKIVKSNINYGGFL